MKRIRLIVMVVAVMVIGVVAIACFRAREPRYQGRTLSEWIEEGGLAFDEHGGKPKADPTFQSAKNAVQQIGTNAIPFLLDWVQAKDSPLKGKIIHWMNERHSFHFHIKSDEDLHLKSAYGFLLLGTKAESAWPILIKCTSSTNKSLRFWALNDLFYSKPDKEVFLPVLLRFIHDPDRDLRRFGSDKLHYLYPEEAEAAGVYKMFPFIKSWPTYATETNQPPAK